jgi:hypothetical protein
MERVTRQRTKDELRARRRRRTEAPRNIARFAGAVFVVSAVGNTLAGGESSWQIGLLVSFLIGVPALLLWTTYRLALGVHDSISANTEEISAETLQWEQMAPANRHDIPVQILHGARSYVVAVADEAFVISERLSGTSDAKAWVQQLRDGSLETRIAHIIRFSDIQKMVVPAHGTPEIITETRRHLLDGVHPARTPAFHHRLLGLANKLGFEQLEDARPGTFARDEDVQEATKLPASAPQEGSISVSRHPVHFVLPVLFCLVGFASIRDDAYLGLGAIVLAAAWLVVHLRIGLRIDHDGLTVQNRIRRHRVPWTEVADVRVVPKYNALLKVRVPALMVRTCSGQSIVMTATERLPRRKAASVLQLLRSQQHRHGAEVPLLSHYGYGPEHSLTPVRPGGGPSMLDVPAARNESSMADR